jgi:hypothetical protein
LRIEGVRFLAACPGMMLGAVVVRSLCTQKEDAISGFIVKARHFARSTDAPSWCSAGS